MFNMIRNSFLNAILAVGRRVAGNDRAEAALWCLMKLIRADIAGLDRLLAVFMGDPDEE